MFVVSGSGLYGCIPDIARVTKTADGKLRYRHWSKYNCWKAFETPYVSSDDLEAALESEEGIASLPTEFNTLFTNPIAQKMYESLVEACGGVAKMGNRDHVLQISKGFSLLI